MLGMPQGEIETILVAGTCNIKEWTAEWLNDQADKYSPKLVVYRKDIYGWFISLPSDSDDYDYWDIIPRDLYVLIMYAIGRGCHWLMIDEAAPSVDGLPVYEW